MASRPAPSISAVQASIWRRAAAKRLVLAAHMVDERAAAAAPSATTTSMPWRVSRRMAAALIAGAITGPTQPVSSATRPRRGPAAGNRRRPSPAKGGGQPGRGQPQHGRDRLRAQGQRTAPRERLRQPRGAERPAKAAVIRQHPGQHGAEQAVEQGPRIGVLDMGARVVDEVHVVHARRAGGHAGQARQAAVDMLDHLGGRRPVVLQHVLDQVDAPARRIELVAEQHVGRAGRGAEAAMHAGAQDAVGFRDLAGRRAGRGVKCVCIRSHPGPHPPGIEHALGIEALLDPLGQCRERRRPAARTRRAPRAPRLARG